MVPREWISPVAIQHTLDQHKNETNDFVCQNGVSLTRNLNSNEYSDNTSERDSINRSSMSSLTSSKTQESKNSSSKIINIQWPSIFTSEQNGA